jgi:hypothetical protein
MPGFRGGAPWPSLAIPSWCSIFETGDLIVPLLYHGLSAETP